MQTKNLDIQALRAAAVAMVFLQHARGRIPTSDAYQVLFAHGTFWGGVDIFLAISGFVICGSLFRQGNDALATKLSRGGLVEFWKRRAWRLLPAAWVWLAVSLAIAPFLRTLPFSDAGLVAKAALFAASGMANGFWWDCVQQGGIGKWCPNPDINGVYWSLSLEIQLYLLISVIAFCGSLRTLLLVAVVACIAWPVAGSNFTFAWSFRPQAFCLGVLIYAFTVRFPEALRSIPLALRRAGILVSMAGVYLAPVGTPNQALVMLALASGSSVALASADGAIGSGWLSKVAGWVGDRSYSIYLCHLPVLLMLGEMARRLGLAERPNAVYHAAYMLLALTLILGLSHISYGYVERTTLAWRNRRLPSLPSLHAYRGEGAKGE
jgi:peptidoglycan/LPS O-acetylase OafA/YrhL